MSANYFVVTLHSSMVPLSYPVAVGRAYFGGDGDLPNSGFNLDLYSDENFDKPWRLGGSYHILLTEYNRDITRLALTDEEIDEATQNVYLFTGLEHGLSLEDLFANPNIAPKTPFDGTWTYMLMGIANFTRFPLPQ
jgi:hypothetical protein